MSKIIEEKASPAELESQYGIPLKTLYAWRSNALKATGQKGGNSGQTKFQMVLETAAMNEQELGAYCRAHGIYVEAISKWHRKCEQANDAHASEDGELKKALSNERAINKKLSSDLRRKESALAEAAALLILRKNIRAVFGEPEEE